MLWEHLPSASSELCAVQSGGRGVPGPTRLGKSSRNTQAQWSPTLAGPTPDGGLALPRPRVQVCARGSRGGPRAVLSVLESFTPTASPPAVVQACPAHSDLVPALCPSPFALLDTQPALPDPLPPAVPCENCQSSREGGAG